jgi:drug/metabolite transporter (DMT)-like permease
MTADASRARVALAFTCILLVWGTTYLGIALVLRSFPPFASAGLRFLAAGALLWGLLRLREARPLAGLPASEVVLSGVLMCAGGNGLTVFAMQGVASGTAALLNSTIPICVTLLDWAFFRKRRPRVWTALGLVVGVGGVALIVGETASLGGGRSVAYLGALALAVGTWSVGTLLQRGLVPRERLLALGCGQMLAGGVALVVAAALRGEWAAVDFGAASLESWLALGYLVVFGSLLAQSSYLWLLARMPAEKVTTYAIINPAIALALGGLVLGETVTGASVLGALLVLAGVALVLFERQAAAAVARLLGAGRGVA